MTDDPCIHRVRDCSSDVASVSRCRCGQVFIFVSSGGCGRYKKIQDVTEADAASFDPAMAAEFERFRMAK